MKINIRKEIESDYGATYELVRSAFIGVEHSDNDEHNLVERLRKSDAFIPELSLVAQIDEILVGHIMFTKVTVGDDVALALAPVSVLPEFQKNGIGSALIKEGHKIAKDMGYEYIIVLGSDKYYPKFGYTPAIEFDITAPFEVPSEYFMAIKLQENTKSIKGTVQYAKEFNIC